jgi:drug/metabolite transporter (DMT)-like permease
VVLSYIVLGDSLTATQIVGGVIVVASVVMLARS